MLYGIVKLFDRLGVKFSVVPVFDFGGGEYVKVREYVGKERLAEVYNLYFKLFVSEKGKRILMELIDKVQDPGLANRFRRFFLVELFKGYE